MFTEISWNGYITIVIVLLAVYYLFIGLRYYRDDLLQLLSGRKFPQTDKPLTVLPSTKLDQTPHQANLKQAFEKQDFFQVAQSLGDEIMAYLNEAGRDKLNKEDVMQSLRSLIAKYPPIKNSPFREVIQNLIVTECETNCSIHLSEQELSTLWQVNGDFKSLKNKAK